MPVFKLSMKIIHKNLSTMSIYITIFVVITLLSATQVPASTQVSYRMEKTDIAFFSEESSPLIDGFRENLSEYAHFVDIKDDKNTLQDALYFRNIYYILRIPKGFTEAFMKGEPVQLIKSVVPASAAGAYLDIAIDQYFNTAKLYVKGVPGITQEQLVQNLAKDLSYQTQTTFQDLELAKQNHQFAKSFFNYLAYSMFAVLVLGLTAIIVVLNNPDLRKRNACAPMSQTRLNLEFLLAHLCCTVAAWGIMMIFYFIMDKQSSGYIHTLYFMLNAFVFALCASAISFFIGNLVKNQNAISSICNVVTLGPCFIGGIFVPQELLGPSVLKIASLTSFDPSHTKTVFYYMLIQLGFGLAFLCVSLVLNKKRRMSY
jgi:ABC-2 type transport system permease protein